MSSDQHSAHGAAAAAVIANRTRGKVDRCAELQLEAAAGRTRGQRTQETRLKRASGAAQRRAEGSCSGNGQATMKKILITVTDRSPLILNSFNWRKSAICTPVVHRFLQLHSLLSAVDVNRHRPFDLVQLMQNFKAQTTAPRLREAKQQHGQSKCPPSNAKRSFHSRSPRQ